MLQPVDLVKNSLPAPDQLLLDGIEEDGNCIVLRVRSAVAPKCPNCEGLRVSYHSRYERKMRDLPMLTRPVRICLLVRRFRCHNPSCKRKIFAERLLEIAPRARETKRVAELLGIVGYEMGGNPGARLLKQLGMPGSPDTVLRRLKARLRGYGAGKVRVLGVDDWAQTSALRDYVNGHGEEHGDRLVARPFC